ncbi:hypothetical protein WJX82_008320 [Trebouxia sp. C0006]
MSSPLPLQDWNQAFMLSTPVRPTSRHTPSKTNWKLGTAQRTPQARTPAPLRTPTLSTRRVQQGASLASTPAQCGQRVMPRCAKLQAAADLFELAVKRDVRPATTISRAYGEFLIRHNLPGPTGTSNATVPLSATRRTQVQPRTRFADEEQENSAGQNIISPTKFTATKDDLQLCLRNFGSPVQPKRKDQAVDTRSAAAEEPSDSTLSATTCDLAKRWLVHSNEELQIPVNQLASESHQVADATSGQVTADAAADAFGSEPQHTEEDDDNDDNSSIDTVAAGSTPYLNRSMLSAALQAATPSDSLPGTVEGGVDHAQGTDLSSLMARLLSSEPEAQDEAAGHSEDYDQAWQSAVKHFESRDRCNSPDPCCDAWGDHSITRRCY